DKTTNIQACWSGQRNQKHVAKPRQNNGSRNSFGRANNNHYKMLQPCWSVNHQCVVAKIVLHLRLNGA
ncbi:MAG: hypothetical protein ACK5WI_09450, partial [Cyanobacteriota bacterium]